MNTFLINCNVVVSLHSDIQIHCHQMQVNFTGTKEYAKSNTFLDINQTSVQIPSERDVELQKRRHSIIATESPGHLPSIEPKTI